MKKILGTVALSCLFSATAFAEDFTPGTTTAEGGSTGKEYTYKGGSNFVLNDFDFAVSSTVSLEAAENTQAMAVAAGSSRGRRVFSGSSTGGSVSVCGEIYDDESSPPSDNLVADVTASNGCGSSGS